jgi:DNA-binding NtrC family response regulator
MIYISFVGNHDRWNAEQEISGAMRTIFARYKSEITHVFLLHSGVTPHFNYQESAEKTVQWMQRFQPRVSVELKKLDIESPIDYDLIYHLMYEQVMQILSDPSMRDLQKIINITSGTPTMTACWVLLQKSGLIPNARLVQSFAPELIRNTNGNVVEVDLEIDNFPQITAPDAVKATLNRTSEELKIVKGERDILDLKLSFPRIIGYSSAIMDIKEQIKTEMNETSNVLICGERGTGKQLVAEAIFEEYHNSKGVELRQIDCSGIGENTFLSDLFGHEKGAFTGAITGKIGFIEEDPKSVIFLDEIGNLSLANQNALLWFVQEGKYRPMGSNKVKTGKNRIIAATNVDVNDPELFKSDLLDRFDVIVQTQPLRDHMEDFDLLLKSLLPRDLVLEQSVIKELKRRSWPGNVRSLINWLKPITIKYKGRGHVEWSHIPERLYPDKINTTNFQADELPDLPLIEPWNTWTTKVRFKALKQSGGIAEEAAHLLGMKGDTFRRWFKGKETAYESWLGDE